MLVVMDHRASEEDVDDVVRTIEELGHEAEYLLDLTAVPSAKQETHPPVIADPSHGTGDRDKVPPKARAAVAAGADGLLVEVHPEPRKALSDGAQSLTPDRFEELMGDLEAIASAIDRHLTPPLREAVEAAG